MPTGKAESRKAKLKRLLAERCIVRVDQAAYDSLALALAPVSPGYLRKLLRETGVPLAPSIEGVNQEGFEHLERTLLVLGGAYHEADAFQRKLLRDLVISAKDHARFSVQRAEVGSEKQAIKEEMLLWMRTWLENPGLFPAWVELRKHARSTATRSSEP